MTTLRDALIKAMKRRKSDEARADAVLDFLGLERDDVLVGREDLSSLLDWIAEFEQTVETNYGINKDATYERADQAWTNLALLLGYEGEDP